MSAISPSIGPSRTIQNRNREVEIMGIRSGLNSRSILLVIGLTGAAVVSSGGWASAGPKDVKTTPVLTTDSAELKWTTIGDGQGIPAGAQAAVLVPGDDWHIVRVKLPPHYL